MLPRVRRIPSNTSSSRMISSVYNYLFPKENDSQARSFSTNNPILSNEIAESFHPKLKTIFQQLDAIAPRFVLGRKDIEILTHPVEFYECLKGRISSAKSRVFLSSLYFGKSQHDLVECIDNALKANDDLEVYILIDALRGTREAPHDCSSSILAPLVEKHGQHRVDIRLYHTPHLNGLAKSWVPKRFNEGWGLQHMKLYGFDDEIILSGANLSGDYFTNRQDRYYIFKNKSLVDYYFDIHYAVASLSYRLLPSSKNEQGFKLTWPTSNSSCEPHMNLQRFLSDSSFLLEPLLKQHKLKSFDEFKDTDKFDTIIYPVSQFTPLLQNDTSTEKPAILRLLSYLDSPKIKWWFTAGYFNMLTQYQDRLVNGQSSGIVITASAQANSFYLSPGLSYYIPEAYMLFARRFLEEVKRRGKENLITLKEWKNGIVNTPGGWSYHAKGLWMTVPDEDEPSVTVIGSSNYTKRAYSSDIESNCILITKDPYLRRRMKAEIDNLLSHTETLELSAFEPKLQAGFENGSESGQSDKKSKPVYAVDQNRRVSQRTHMLVKLFGEKL